jgi:hypothetical protein
MAKDNDGLLIALAVGVVAIVFLKKKSTTPVMQTGVPANVITQTSSGNTATNSLVTTGGTLITDVLSKWLKGSNNTDDTPAPVAVDTENPDSYSVDPDSLEYQLDGSGGYTFLA